MERGLLLYFPSFFFLSSKESMSESGSVANGVLYILFLFC